jgi:hypothetical protein
MSDFEQLAQQEIIQIVNAYLVPETSINAFQEKLSAYIAELINHDFGKLINILYRLDVSEQKLRALLASSAATDAGLLIAELIIERQSQKIKSRRQFNQRGKNIADEERW